MLGVMMVSPAPEFNFDSACTTPYTSAPSSPRGFTHYYYTSAPTSPSTATAIYNEFSDGCGGGMTSSAVVPYYWRENSDSPKGRVCDGDEEEEEEFDFEFSGQLLMGSDEGVTATADELFEAGVIRQLKKSTPQLVQIDDSNGDTSKPDSPESLSLFRQKAYKKPLLKATNIIGETSRGRDRVESFASGRERSSSRRSTRSLSPLRRESLNFREKSTSRTPKNRVPVPPTTVSKSSAGAGGGASKKWKIRDFFLFRSASEGRVKGNGKDPLTKYTAALSASDDLKRSSFRSTDSGSVGRRSSGRNVSSTQYYGSNRVVSEDQRRKTFLPYRQGLLGCLGFNPSVDGLAKAFGSIAGGHRR